MMPYMIIIIHSVLSPTAGTLLLCHLPRSPANRVQIRPKILPISSIYHASCLTYISSFNTNNKIEKNTSKKSLRDSKSKEKRKVLASQRPVFNNI